MADIEKRIKSWIKSKPNIPRRDLEAVLNRYFPGWKSGSGTSHIYKIFHEKLVDNPNYFNGHFVIPVTSGKTIKPVYIKQLLKAIEIIKEKEIN
jgi:hypothetical protein